MSVHGQSKFNDTVILINNVLLQNGTTNLIDVVNKEFKGNADTATSLKTSRNIGGVPFNGAADINLPGVNTSGNQNTSGNAATATLASTAIVTGSSNNSDLPIVFNNDNTLLDDTTLTFNASSDTLKTSNLSISSLLLTNQLSITGNSTFGNHITLNSGKVANIAGALSVTGQSKFSNTVIFENNVLLQDGTTNLIDVANKEFKGNADTATTLQTARNIGGVSFDGSNAITPEQISIVDDTANNDRLICFADGNGTQNIKNNSNLSYNPSAKTFKMNNLSIVQESNGNINMSAGTNNKIIINGSEFSGDTEINGKLIIDNANNGDVPLTIQATNNQSGNLLEIQNHSNTKYIKVNSSGLLSVGTEITVDDLNISSNTLKSLNNNNINFDSATGTINFKQGTTDLGNITASGYSGNAATATALETARNIGGVSFDGSANINLPGVNTGGNQDTSGNAATATALETARNIGGVSFDGTANINLPGVNTGGNQDTTGSAATLTNARNIGGVSFDGSADINLPGVNTGGNQDTSGNAATATALETARNIGGVSFDGTANINLPGVNTGGNQDTTGSAATLTNARNIGGVSFDGSADINLPGVNTGGNQDTSGNAATATALETARNIGGVSFNGSADIDLPGVNTAGNQNTSGNAATATALASSVNIGSAPFDGSGNISIRFETMNQAGTPSQSGAGTAVFNINESKLYIHNGSGWKSVQLS